MRRYLVAAVAVALGLSACSSDKGKESTTATTSGANATTTTVGLGTTTTAQFAESGDYVNGRHIGNITSADSAKRRFTVDVIQFLTGQAAIDAYKADGGEQDAPDNDYYIRNQSTQLRTFTVAADATIAVNNAGGYDPSQTDNGGHYVQWQTFAGYFTGEDASRAKLSHFWFTVRDGEVVDIFEQFTP